MEGNSVRSYSFASINTHGLKANSDYILNELVENNDILFVCEHWLSNAEKHILNKKSHKLHFSPAEKQPAGRPYGGNCFLVRKDINIGVKIIHEDSHILAIECAKLRAQRARRARRAWRASFMACLIIGVPIFGVLNFRRAYFWRA